MNALFGTLKDQSLQGKYHIITEAIMSALKAQSLKCDMFLPQVRSSVVSIG